MPRRLGAADHASASRQRPCACLGGGSCNHKRRRANNGGAGNLVPALTSNGRVPDRTEVARRRTCDGCTICIVRQLVIRVWHCVRLRGTDARREEPVARGVLHEQRLGTLLRRKVKCPHVL
eukprot:Amastigsp_a174496_138.p4 type:complete len:121 gc:universal Amastigsp_a174496_138:1843-2205(+)